MKRIFVVGTGNLGEHLVRQFEAHSNSNDSSVQLVGYHNKHSGNLSEINTKYYKDLGDIPTCDLILLAVNDDSITDVVKQLNIGDKTTVAHTSGSVPLSALEKFSRHGVFYWPQSFSNDRNPKFEEITLCWEASDSDVAAELILVGSTLSRKQKELNTAERRKLHLAAVYINNFVNHCYSKGYEYLENHDLPPNLLYPLMKETMEKAIALHPHNSQTGPARRNDTSTINTHIEQLKEVDLEMYRSITRSIIKSYEKL